MTTSATDSEPLLEVLIVGAGFGGMYMLYRLRMAGFRVRAFERASNVGGTWYWNRYPGARCDVESMSYSYAFDEALQQEWEWTERYAAQPEILKYANHVADRFDLRVNMEFNVNVVGTDWDDNANFWRVRLKGTDGGARTVTARHVVMATGCLSTANLPDIPGRDNFQGSTYHTGCWPHEGVDFTGQRVAVIGTGSSAIQSIPIIAEQAAELIVLQRTPNYAVPAHNAPLNPDKVAAVKANYGTFRQIAQSRITCVVFDLPRPSALLDAPTEREAEFERRWQIGGLGFMGAYGDLLRNQTSNQYAADFVRSKIRQIVNDPETAKKLSPDNEIGCKRLCVDTGYYTTYNRSNVHLIDLRDTPIRKIMTTGIDLEGTDLIEVDAIVFATGFDAMTGTLTRIDIRGRGGLALREVWEAGPRTYLGLSVAGFPNLFIITGPGSPSVLTNMIPAIEQHVEWITDCLVTLRNQDKTVMEADLAAQNDWVEHVNLTAESNLRSHCSSWYIGANIEGKPKIFMPYIGGYPAYRTKCDEVAARGYEGFTKT